MTSMAKMTKILIQAIFFSINLIAPTKVWSEEAIPAKPVQMTIQSFVLENKSYLAISFENFPHWHTYWKNPGDAGLARTWFAGSRVRRAFPGSACRSRPGWLPAGGIRHAPPIARSAVSRPRPGRPS
jgi:hypothetical protein